MSDYKKYDLGLRDLITFRPDTLDESIIRAILIDRTEYGFFIGAQPKIIFDVGANIGCTSILLANSYPDAYIYAFEPDPENFDLLSTNVKAYNNVLAWDFALGAVTQKRELFASDDARNSGGFSFHEGGSDTSQFKTVQVFDVREFMADQRIEHIDLLKIDTEGCEYEILNALEGRMPTFIMGEAHGVDDGKMFDMLAKTHHYQINKALNARVYPFYAQARTFELQTH